MFLYSTSSRLVLGFSSLLCKEYYSDITWAQLEPLCDVKHVHVFLLSLHTVQMGLFTSLIPNRSSLKLFC
jgi:hypothetical protein